MKVLHYYSAPWCQPCKVLKPQVRKIVDELGVMFAEFNVDEQTPLIPNIMGVPTIAIYEQGSGEPLVVLSPQQATPSNVRKWLA